MWKKLRAMLNYKKTSSTRYLLCCGEDAFLPQIFNCMSSLGFFLGVQAETWFLQMLSLRSSHGLLVDLKTRQSVLGNEVLFFLTLLKVMTSGFNAQAFKYFSWKSARDHPEYSPAQGLGNSSGSSGVTLFHCFWFWEEIQPEAGRILSSPIVMNSIAYQTLTWEGASQVVMMAMRSICCFSCRDCKSLTNSSWSIITLLWETVCKCSCSSTKDQ